MSFQSWSRSHLRSGLQLAGIDHLLAASANACQVIGGAIPSDRTPTTTWVKANQRITH